MYFDKCSVRNPPLQFSTEYFLSLKNNTLFFTYSTLLPLKTPAISNLFTVSTILPFPEVIYMKLYSFSNWLISISNVHLGFIQFFCGFTTNFLYHGIVLHCLHVPRLIYSPIEDMMIASSFCQLWIKLLSTSTCMLLYRHRFSNLWVNN